MQQTRSLQYALVFMVTVLLGATFATDWTSTDLMECTSGLQNKIFDSDFSSFFINGQGKRDDDAHLILSDAESYNRGSAFYDTTVPVGIFRMEAKISVKECSQDGLWWFSEYTCADGMAFVVQASDEGKFAVGNDGSALGYAGISNGFAVEFDNYQNTFGTVNDPSHSHVSIHQKLAADEGWRVGDLLDVTELGNGEGTELDVVVEYGPRTVGASERTMRVKVNGQAIGGDVPLDFPLLDGKAFVGWTASTGTLFATHHIHEMKYFTTTPKYKDSVTVFHPNTEVHTAGQVLTARVTVLDNCQSSLSIFDVDWSPSEIKDELSCADAAMECSFRNLYDGRHEIEFKFTKAGNFEFVAIANDASVAVNDRKARSTFFKVQAADASGTTTITKLVKGDGSVDLGNTQEFPDPAGQYKVGVPTKFAIIFKDEYGNDAEVTSERISVTMTGGTVNPDISYSTQNQATKDSVWIVTFDAKKAGSYNLGIYLDNLAIAGFPRVVEVISGDPEPTECSIEGAGATTARAGDKATLTVVVRDPYGNVLKTNDAPSGFKYAWKDASQATHADGTLSSPGVDPEMDTGTWDQEGRFQVSYTPEVSGEHVLLVSYNDVVIGDGNGNTVYVAPKDQTDPSKCTVEADLEGCTDKSDAANCKFEATVGVTNQVTIYARDEFSNRRVQGGDVVQVIVKNNAGQTQGTTTALDESTGVYIGSFSVDTTETHTITVKVTPNGGTSGTKDYHLVPISSFADAGKSKVYPPAGVCIANEACEGYFRAKDKYDNDIIHGDPISFAAEADHNEGLTCDTDGGEVCKDELTTVDDTDKWKYHYSLKLQRAGLWTLKGALLVGEVEVDGSETITVEPGASFGANTGVDLSGLKATSGAEADFNIIPRDKWNNALLSDACSINLKNKFDDTGSVKIVCGAKELATVVSLADSGDYCYLKVTFTPTDSGTCGVEIVYDNEPVLKGNEGWSFFVAPSKTADWTTSTVDDVNVDVVASASDDEAAKKTLIVRARDSSSNLVSKPDSDTNPNKITAHWTDDGSQKSSTCTYNDLGYYQCKYWFTKSGDHQITVKGADTTNIDTVTVTVVADIAVSSESVIETANPEAHTVGSKYVVDLRAKDQFGNDVSSSGNSCSVGFSAIFSLGSTSFDLVCTPFDGLFRMSTATNVETSGDYTLNIYLSGTRMTEALTAKGIQSSDSVTVSPGTVSASKSTLNEELPLRITGEAGEGVEFRVNIRDTHSNSITDDALNDVNLRFKILKQDGSKYFPPVSGDEWGVAPDYVTRVTATGTIKAFYTNAEVGAHDNLALHIQVQNGDGGTWTALEGSPFDGKSATNTANIADSSIDLQSTPIQCSKVTATSTCTINILAGGGSAESMVNTPWNVYMADADGNVIATASTTLKSGTTYEAKFQTTKAGSFFTHVRIGNDPVSNSGENGIETIVPAGDFLPATSSVSVTTTTVTAGETASFDVFGYDLKKNPILDMSGHSDGNKWKITWNPNPLTAITRNSISCGTDNGKCTFTYTAKEAGSFKPNVEYESNAFPSSSVPSVVVLPARAYETTVETISPAPGEALEAGNSFEIKIVPIDRYKNKCLNDLGTPHNPTVFSRSQLSALWDSEPGTGAYPSENTFTFQTVDGGNNNWYIKGTSSAIKTKGTDYRIQVKIADHDKTDFYPESTDNDKKGEWPFLTGVKVEPTSIEPSKCTLESFVGSIVAGAEETARVTIRDKFENVIDNFFGDQTVNKPSDFYSKFVIKPTEATPFEFTGVHSVITESQVQYLQIAYALHKQGTYAQEDCTITYNKDGDYESQSVPVNAGVTVNPGETSEFQYTGSVEVAAGAEHELRIIPIDGSNAKNEVPVEDLPATTKWYWLLEKPEDCDDGAVTAVPATRTLCEQENRGTEQIFCKFEFEKVCDYNMVLTLVREGEDDLSLNVPVTYLPKAETSATKSTALWADSEWAADNEIIAGASNKFTIQIRDEFGNDRTPGTTESATKFCVYTKEDGGAYGAGVEAEAFGTTAAQATQRRGTVQITERGTHNVQVTYKTSGDCSTHGGNAIGDSDRTLVVKTSEFSAESTYVDAPNADGTPTAGVEHTITIHLMDAFDNIREVEQKETDDAALSVSVEHATQKDSSGDPIRVSTSRTQPDGTYTGQWTVKFTPELAGSYIVRVFYGSTKLIIKDQNDGRQYGFTILPDTTSREHTTVAGPGLLNAVAGVETQFEIVARDQFGNPVERTGDEWQLSFTPAAAKAGSIDISEKVDTAGTYVVKFTHEVSTTTSPRLKYKHTSDGVDFADVASFNDKNLQLIVIPNYFDPVNSNVVIEGGEYEITAGKSKVFTINARDEHNNPEPLYKEDGTPRTRPRDLRLEEFHVTFDKPEISVVGSTREDDGSGGKYYLVKPGSFSEVTGWTFSVTSEVAQDYKMVVKRVKKHDGTATNDQVDEVDVKIRPDLADITKIQYLDPNGIMQKDDQDNEFWEAHASSLMSFTILAFDQYNNECDNDADNWVVAIRGPLVATTEDDSTQPARAKTPEEVIAEMAEKMIATRYAVVNKVPDTNRYDVTFIPYKGGKYDLNIKVEGRQSIEPKDLIVKDAVCNEPTPFRCPDTNECVLNPTECPGIEICSNAAHVYCQTDFVNNAPVLECTEPSNCACADGLKRCDSGQCSDFCLPPPVCDGHVCSDGSCKATVSDCPTSVSCSPGTIICPDGRTCALSASECTELNPDCQGAVMCPTKTCAVSLDECPTGTTCKAGQILCGDGSCREKAEDCLQPFQCLPPFTFRCLDQSCRKSAEDCPTLTTCPVEAPVLCEDGSCSAAVGLGDNGCKPVDECPTGQMRCPDGSCQINPVFCPTPVTCPPRPETPHIPMVKCEDGSCRVSSEDCPEVPDCPGELPIRCPAGSCAESVEECPTATTCPVEYPVLCADKKTCTDKISECPPVINCPAHSPVSCPDGSCAADIVQCPTMITCSGAYPVKCSDGSCVHLPDHCTDKIRPRCPSSHPFDLSELLDCVALDDPTLVCAADPDACFDDSLERVAKRSPGQCPEGEILCPVGLCAKALGLCPTPISCLIGEIRCHDNVCRETLAQCSRHVQMADVCEDVAIWRCPNGQCRETIVDCPSMHICPIDMPVKCPDHSCRAQVQDCFKQSECRTQRESAKDPVYTLCADGVTCLREQDNEESGQASSVLCGTELTCQAEKPVLCPDGQCVADIAECVSSEFSTCPRPGDLPQKIYRCADGGCVEDVGMCQPSSACKAHLPVKCSGSKGKCLESSSACSNDDGVMGADSCPNLLTRCPDGVCRYDTGDSESESDQFKCPAPKCPARVPYLCQDGRCVTDKDKCWLQNGCPPTAPVKCGTDGSCQKNETDCPGAAACPDGQPRCPDGSCKDPKIESCPVMNGCPSANFTNFCSLDHPDICVHTFKCATGACVIDDGTPSCPFGGLCPAPFTHRCPNGLCVRNAKYCPPVTEADISSCQEPGFSVPCADGTCAPSGDECPLLPACGKSILNPVTDKSVDHVRCPDGSCRERLDLCPPAETCPPERPHRCDVGTNTGTYNGMCVKDADFCAADGSACPAKFPFRCDNGACAETRTDCDKDAFKIKIEANGCAKDAPFKCWNGECVDDASNCKATSGCAGNKPIRCPLGGPNDCFPASEAETECVEAEEHKSCEDKGKITCVDGACADKWEECRTTHLCPVTAPIRCADGSCKKFAIGSEGCTPTAVCPTSFPVKCADGSCVASSDLCQSLLPCSEDTPYRCDDNSCALNAEGCETVFADAPSCPIESPTLCPKGECAKTAADCALNSQCRDASRPVMCADGACRATAQECVANMQPDKNGKQCLEGELDGFNSKNFLCADGSCVPEQTMCTSVAACPIDKPVRCPNGNCVSASRPCTAVDSCESLDLPKHWSRCDDGVCRRNCTATPNVCQGISCPDGTCQKCTDTACTGAIALCESKSCSTSQVLCFDKTCDDKSKLEENKLQEFCKGKTPMRLVRPPRVQETVNLVQGHELTLIADDGSPIGEIRVPSGAFDFKNYLENGTASGTKTKRMSAIRIEPVPDDKVNATKNVWTNLAIDNFGPQPDFESLDWVVSPMLKLTVPEDVIQPFRIPLELKLKASALPREDFSYDQLCLAYLNEELDQWECADRDISVDAGGTGVVTGKVVHNTIYALVVNPKVNGDEKSQQSLWDQYGVVILCSIIGGGIFIAVCAYVIMRLMRYRAKWRQFKDKANDLDMTPMYNAEDTEANPVGFVVNPLFLAQQQSIQRKLEEVEAQLHEKEAGNKQQLEQASQEAAAEREARSKLEEERKTLEQELEKLRNQQNEASSGQQSSSNKPQFKTGGKKGKAASPFKTKIEVGQHILRPADYEEDAQM